MLPLWLTLAILAGLSSNAFNFFSRYVLKDKDDSTAYAWYLNVLRLIVFSVFAVFDWRIVLTPQAILMLLLYGVVDAIGIYFYMKMHSYTHLSVSSILSRTRMIWIPIFAFFLVGEHLKPQDYIGILILFTGVSLISAPRKLFVDKGVLYANAAAIIFAFGIVLNKMVLSYASDSVVNAALAFPAVVIFPFLMKSPKKRINTLLHTNIKLKSLGIGLNIISIFLFTWALRAGADASKANAIYQGMLVFSVLAGIFLLKEKEDTAKKLIGTAITIAGVLILSLS